MPPTLVPEAVARVLLLVCAAVFPLVDARLLHFGGVSGHRILQLLLHVGREGVHLGEGVLVLTADFGKIDKGCGGVGKCGGVYPLA